MAQFDQSTAGSTSTTRQVNAAPERVASPTQGSGMVIGIASALVVVAGAWFFYHQGQRDALRPVPIPAAAVSETASPTETTPVSADGTPAATMVQTPSYGQPDIIVTAHPTQEQAANAANSQPAAPVRPKTTHAVKTRTMMAAAAKPLDRDVALTSRPRPAYPPQALRAAEQGTVLVLAQVDVDGHVSDAHVVRRSGSNILDHAAPDEVRRWKFQPALRDGHPIAANVEVPVSYRLDQ